MIVFSLLINFTCYYLVGLFLTFIIVALYWFAKEMECKRLFESVPDMVFASVIWPYFLYRLIRYYTSKK